jgi:NAD+ kinase
MKVVVVGHARKIVEDVLQKFSLKLDTKNPDIVISFGGDGTALYGERVYPGVPRILIKHSKTCNKCKEHDFSEIFSKLKNCDYKIKEEIKVEGIVNDDPKKRLVGLNEIGVHHEPPTKAIRLRVKVNEKIIEDEIIGDGVIVATPYGSTGYFHSISRMDFSKGLGIAYNNPMKKIKNQVVDEESLIEIEILRNQGWMTVDNYEEMIPIKKGDIIKIYKAKEKAKIIELGGQTRIKI